ncbi:hypothetical protein EMCRGX_G016912 [Ephydatia muelleri]
MESLSGQHSGGLGLQLQMGDDVADKADNIVDEMGDDAAQTPRLVADKADNSADGSIIEISNHTVCPGNATRWNMCYYSSKTDNTNAAYLAVYRPSGTQYSLVSGFSSSYSVSPIMSGYSCSQFSIPQSQQFVVQQGDVIAACVQPSGSGRVGIVATASGSLRAQLYTGSPSIPCFVLDINECAVNNGGCNQTCVDTDVGYNCNCFSGFQLASDMKNCTELVQQSSATLPDSIVITIVVIVATVVIVTALVFAIAVSIAHLRRKHTSTKPTPINATAVTADCGNIMVEKNEAYQSREEAITQLNKAYGKCTHEDCHKSRGYIL